MTPPATPPATLLADALAAIGPADAAACAAAEQRQALLTKPPGSLGQLETLGNRLAAIAGACPPPVPEPAVLCVFAGDHGVWAQGVSPWPQAVTAQMVANVAAGGASVSVLARHAGADIRLYDLGVAGPLPAHEGVRRHRIAAGTADLSAGPAMTREQCLRAVGVGLQAAADAAAAGYRCLLAGEVGIGNTTPAAALVSVFTGRPAAEVTGAGAGATGADLDRKKAVVARGIAVNGASAADPLGALAAVGGFEHAAIVGYLLGAARHRLPVILDGVIVCSAALVAVALAPAVRDYLIAGHDGVEPGIRAALEVLRLDPVLALDLRLGEGSGALTALPVVQAAAKILREMATFTDAGVSGRE
jgi:nicotinate-nucleotide--dimethylbenzimidazole phosphoribosyltransferase